ncbi:hypothetical protein HDU96_010201 [Phlyctochytrium bullatum]|nr:hypothetical protein HDU96_010201 [Phlyctochytrium bullatum]
MPLLSPTGDMQQQQQQQRSAQRPRSFLTAAGYQGGGGGDGGKSSSFLRDTSVMMQQRQQGQAFSTEQQSRQDDTGVNATPGRPRNAPKPLETGNGGPPVMPETPPTSAGKPPGKRYSALVPSQPVKKEMQAAGERRWLDRLADVAADPTGGDVASKFQVSRSFANQQPTATTTSGFETVERTGGDPEGMVLALHAALRKRQDVQAREIEELNRELATKSVVVKRLEDKNSTLAQENYAITSKHKSILTKAESIFESMTKASQMNEKFESTYKELENMTRKFEMAKKRLLDEISATKTGFGTNGHKEQMEDLKARLKTNEATEKLLNDKVNQLQDGISRLHSTLEEERKAFETQINELNSKNVTLVHTLEAERFRQKQITLELNTKLESANEKHRDYFHGIVSGKLEVFSQTLRDCFSLTTHSSTSLFTTLQRSSQALYASAARDALVLRAAQDHERRVFARCFAAFSRFVGALAPRVDRFRGEHECFVARIGDVWAAFKRIVSEMGTIGGAVAEIKQELRVALSKRKQAVAKLRARRGKLQNLLAKRESLCAALKQTVAGLEKDREVQTNKNEMLNEFLASSREQVYALSKENGTLRDELASVKAEYLSYPSLRTHIYPRLSKEQMLKTIAGQEMKYENMSMSSKMESLKEEINVLKAKREQEHAEWREQEAKVQNILKEKDAVARQLESEKVEHSRMNEELKKTIMHQDSEIRRLESKITSTRAELEGMYGRVANLSAEKEMMSNEIAGLQRQIKDSDKDKTEVAEKSKVATERALAEVERLKAAAEKLEREVAAKSKRISELEVRSGVGRGLMVLKATMEHKQKEQKAAADHDAGAMKQLRDYIVRQESHINEQLKNSLKNITEKEEENAKLVQRIKQYEAELKQARLQAAQATHAAQQAAQAAQAAQTQMAQAAAQAATQAATQAAQQGLPQDKRKIKNKRRQIALPNEDAIEDFSENQVEEFSKAFMR